MSPTATTPQTGTWADRHLPREGARLVAEPTKDPQHCVNVRTCEEDALLPVDRSPADFPMPLALGRRVSQFSVVVEERLVLARLAVDVAVPLVEAAGAGVVPVDVDLEQLPATLSGHRLGGREQCRAETSSAQLGRDVELVEQGDRAVVPNVRAQGQQRDGDRGVAGQQGDHVPPLAKSRPSRVVSTAFPGVGVSYSRLNASSNPATLATSATVATRGVSIESCSIPASVSQRIGLWRRRALCPGHPETSTV